MNEPHIVYCRCAYSQEVPAEVKDEVLAALAGSGAPFDAVADLCELAARRDPLLARWARDDHLRVVACHPRAVRWLFHAGGADLPRADERVLDMKAAPAGEIAAALEAHATADPAGVGPRADVPPGDVPHVVLYEGPGARPMDAPALAERLAALLDAGYRVTRTGPGRPIAPDGAAVVIGEFEGGEVPADLAGGSALCRDVTGLCPCGTTNAVHEARRQLGLPEPDGWIPWFPVIDYDRCVGCRQCANFCIFGVHEVDDDGTVRVVNPANCKTNCPACARMCKQVAIIFPKYPSGPIDGDVVREADVRKEKAGTDLKQLLRGDVYTVLRQRGKGVVGLGDGPGGRPSPADLARMAGELEIPAAALEALDAEGGADPPGGGDGEAERPCCEDGDGKVEGEGETKRDGRK